MMKLPNAEQMRKIDQCAINEFKIPGMVLMENAGVGTVALMARLLGTFKNRFIPIFIGPGNNGGDGLVIARHLYQKKAVPLLVFVVEPKRLKGDSASNLAIVNKLDITAVTCTSPNALQQVSETIAQMAFLHGPPLAIVDSIFGTGLDRDVEGYFFDTIELINSLSSATNTPVIAVDTPSGLCSGSGAILGCCIKAWATATYGYAKIGQVLPSNLPLVGKLEVIDIGIPPEVLDHVVVEVSAVDQQDYSNMTALLKRSTENHKGSFGHLLILGGSAGKTGAALLAARGAIRSGCGLVSICTPSGLNTIYESALAEAMTLVLDTPNFLSIDDVDKIVGQLENKSCIVIGPGLGLDVKSAELVLELYQLTTIPMIIDADALNILALQKNDLPTPSGPRIFTPHPGEMARLTGLSTSQVQTDRMAALRACYEHFKTPDSELIIVLKGSGTLTTNGDSIWVNRTGNASMAAGGMGDVLSGLIGSFVCQGMSPVDAARYGVHLHGLSGDRLQTNIGVGFNASDLADELSPALKAVMEEEK